MSYMLAGAAISTRPHKLTTTTVTDLYVATKRTTILSVAACEIAGSTPDYTLELYDGATSYYLYNSYSMTEHETLIYNEPFVLNTGWHLRATAGTADQIDVFVTYAEPDSTALRPGGL